MLKLCAGTAPRPKRSSGTKCRPNWRRSIGPMADTSISAPPVLTSTLPRGAPKFSPDSANIISFWPLPDTPAIPTTSPAHTCKLMWSRSQPNWSSRGRLKALTRSTIAPGSLLLCKSAGGSLPIMRRDNDAFDSLAGLHTPVTRPPRRTVQAVHSARISCSLWLMYKILQPWLANLRSTSNSLSTACGVSTEVGSSRIKILGWVSSARIISTRCIWPTLSE